MNSFSDYNRVGRLIRTAINNFSLNLEGINVLTEAASGVFVVTPIIAALAGADKVIAVTQNSRYGTVEEVKKHLSNWAREFGVEERIEITTEKNKELITKTHLITNLGFVRPIDDEMISLLPADAAIALMWETWEYRPEDVDIEACRKHNIPILGTKETDYRLQTFRYQGMVALKLLLEANIEVYRSMFMVIGSGHIGMETRDVLVANGAKVLHLNPLEKWEPNAPELEQVIEKLDAIVVVEHQSNALIIGENGGISPRLLRKGGTKIIHVCGAIDYQSIEKNELEKIPNRRVSSGFVTLTTDYVGPCPVVDLHTAGLKVGESLVRGMRLHKNVSDATTYAMKHSPCMEFPKKSDNGQPNIYQID